MSDIALRTYVQQLDNLIERKHVDEAVAHCRHILSYFPKHLDTYRMLGKALLEKGRHGDAADVFQRVLSVLPDDFISHVGMAIVREDEANLDAALWHMERAFEAMPSNGAIQQELCRLYGRRDGVVPPKARLTRGALGRMYVQGGLYRQAEAELKAALAEDQERIDLNALLAKAYWLDGQPALAAPLCGQILQKLPYSQVANRIVFDIFAQQQQPAEGAVYRRRLEALDPYETHVPASSDGVGVFGAADQIEASQVQLPRLDYVAGMEASGSPDWIASIGARFEEPVAAAGEKSPDWLGAALSAESEEASGAGRDWLADIEAATTTAASTPPSGWLHDLGSGPKAPPAEAQEPTLPDWLQPPTGPLSPQKVPDWMIADKAAADETLATGSPPAEPEEVPVWMRDAVAPHAPTADDLPEWLRGLEPGAPAEPAALEPSQPDMTTAPLGEPDAGAADLDTTRVHAPAPSEAAEQTLLHQPPAEPATAPLAGTTTPPPAEVPPPPWLQEATAAVGADDLPDWLKTALSPTPKPLAQEPAEPVTTQPLAEPEGQVTLVAQPLAPVAPPAGEETLIQQPEAQQPAALPEPEAPPAQPAQAEELPAWLQTAAPASTQGQPSWLDGLAGLGAAAALAAQPALPPSEEPAALEDTLPDWLADATSTGAAEASTPWLQTIEPASVVPVSAPEQPVATEAAYTAQPEPVEPTEPEAAAALPGADEGLPDWLKAATSAAPTADRPAWQDELAEPSGGTAAMIAQAAQPSMPGASVPDEALPDWLVDATSASSLEAGTPWLQTLEPLAAPLVPSEVSVPSEPPIPEPELPVEAVDEQPAGEALPDWLASAVSPGVVEEQPAWLEAALPPAAEASAEPGLAAEAGEEGAMVEPAERPEAPLPPELPDWLKAVAAAAPPPDVYTPSPVEQPAAPPAQTPVELPDFLQLASPEAIARAAQPFAIEDELPESESAEAAAALEPAEIPDWLKALAPEPTELAQTPSSAEALAAADINLDDVPDWLQAAAREPTAPEAVAPAESEQPAIEPAPAEVPDWLQVNQAEGAAVDLPPWAQAVEPGPTDTVANWLASKEIPEWLRQAREEARGPVVPETPAQAETLAAAEAEPAAALEPMPAQPELSATEAVDAKAISEAIEQPAGGLGDWLSQAEAGLPLDVLADTAPHQAPPPPEPPAALPGWLLAAEETARESEPEIPARPDWLPAEVAAGAPALAEPAAEADLAAMSAEEALSWLEGLAARQGAKPEELLTMAPTESPAEAAAADTVAMETRAELAAEQAAPVDAGLAGGERDLAAMDADEALRWLEGLAAQQGARPEELLTTPQERPTETPAWIAAQQQATPPGEPVAAERHEPELPAIPDWLADIEAVGEMPAEAPVPPEWLAGVAASAQAETPVPDQAVPAGPEAPAQAAEPDLGAMDADEAMRWLESLAARQGAPPEELITAPGERPVATPEWIVTEQMGLAAQASPQAETPPAAEAEVEPASQAAAPQPAAAEVEASVAAAAVEQQPPEEPAPSVPASGGDVAKLSRLADKLAAARRAKEAEIEARFAEQRAEQEAARRQVWESMQAKKAAVEAASQAPAEAAPVRATRPQTRPLPPLPAEVPAPVAPVEDSAWKPAAPPRGAGRRPTSRYASQDPERVLDLAREYLADGEQDFAAEAMEHLVRSGAKVDAVIQVLETATSARPATVPMLRVLGDAYVQTNRIQDALEVYRQALSRL